MSHSTTFVGAGLALQSVTQLGLSTLRVRFTQDPVASSPIGSYDALNPANYTLTGPMSNVLGSVTKVADDSQAFTLHYNAPFLSGNYTLTVANIKSTINTDLVDPKTMDVTITVIASGMADGAENDNAEKVLRKHLSPALKGHGWDALIAALSTGDQKNWDISSSAFDQLFKISASGKYLDRKAADDGIVRPRNIGMPDELFRQFAIKATAAKLTPHVILEILEIFYGSQAVRAYVDSATTDPFALSDGYDLRLILDEKDEVTVTFKNSDFATIGAAKGIEVAAAITRALKTHGLQAFAVPIRDAETGKTTVRIYSGALGLGSSVRVVGGRAQNILQFPNLLNVFTGI